MNTQSFLTAAALAGLALAAPAGQAARFSFHQGGFDEGATITGYFEVDDLPPLGIIEAGDPAIFPGFTLDEIVDFSVSFSGNSLVGPFTQTLADLSALNYLLGTPYLGDTGSEGIATNVTGGATRYDYYSGMGFGGFGGAVTDNLSGGISRSEELVQVPAPATPWLVGGGLATLLGWRRRT